MDATPRRNCGSYGVLSSFSYEYGSLTAALLGIASPVQMKKQAHTQQHIQDYLASNGTLSCFTIAQCLELEKAG